MTTTSSAISATTPRSCVIMMIALPNSLLQALHQVEDLRLRGHVERGRRLVGDQQVGVVDERHRDHHALAHAARELVRVVVDAAARRAGCRPPSGARARALGPRPSRRPGGAGSPRRAASRSCAPGSARSSDPGRSSRSRCRGSRAAASGSSRAGPRPSRAPRRSRSCVLRLFRPMIVRQVTLLPQPDSPTMPSVLPFSTDEADAVDGLDDAVVGPEVGLQVVDVEKRLAPIGETCLGWDYPSRMRGSITA